jgi:hypothetical protein
MTVQILPAIADPLAHFGGYLVYETGLRALSHPQPKSAHSAFSPISLLLAQVVVVVGANGLVARAANHGFRAQKELMES